MLKKKKDNDNEQMILFPPPNRDKTHVDWVKAYVNIWTELQNYIKQHHTTGLTWSKSVSITINNLLFVKKRTAEYRCCFHIR